MSCEQKFDNLKSPQALQHVVTVPAAAWQPSGAAAGKAALDYMGTIVYSMMWCQAKYPAPGGPVAGASRVLQGCGPGGDFSSLRVGTKR